MEKKDFIGWLFRILIPTMAGLILSLIISKTKLEFILFFVFLFIFEHLLRRFFPIIPLFNSMLLTVAYINIYLYVLYIVLKIGWIGDLSRFISIGIGLVIIIRKMLFKKYTEAD